MHHRQFIEIAFHHNCMTAKPLFEIFRAIVVQMVSASIEAQELRQFGRHDWLLPIPDFTDSDRETFHGLLKTVAKEYGELTELRNGLLHGSWFVGYESSIDFDLHKYTVTKDGLARLDLPESTAQVLELCNRCSHVIPWLHKIEACLTGMYKLADQFEYSSGDWVMIAGHTTLPENKAKNRQADHDQRRDQRRDR